MPSPLSGVLGGVVASGEIGACEEYVDPEEADAFESQARGTRAPAGTPIGAPSVVR